VAARADGLLDSNVLIALLAEAHEHHAASIALLLGEGSPRFAVAAHSYAETYSTLTRRGGPAPFGFAPGEAWAALESVRAVTDLVGLTAGQTFDVVRRYAGDGGVGPRLYDRLTGEAAVAHGLPRIVTWNVTHMRGLFPRLNVATPAEMLGASDTRAR
jgi:predicted nucleic acid-binding protein